MWTTNNLFRRVLNCTHSKWWFTQFERKCNILEIFHYFQYFDPFRSMKKWQIWKPKIVDWYLDFSNESYTTLKSVISSFKICFQNYGQLKRTFLRPKNTSSTFLKFELSSQRADAKNLEKYNKKSVWATVVSWYQLSETKTCLYSMNMTSRVCITVSNSPNPFSVHIRSVYQAICKHRKKVLYCFYKITFPRKNAKLFVMALIKREILISRKVLYTKSCMRNQFLFCKKMLLKIWIFLA